MAETMQAHCCRLCDASSFDRFFGLIGQLVPARALRPSYCGQHVAAKATRPWKTGLMDFWFENSNSQMHKEKKKPATPAPPRTTPASPRTNTGHPGTNTGHLC